MMEYKDTIYAPVVIPTLCRYEHLKRCITTLSVCKGADETELYIGLDYPANESHYKGYGEICNYLPTITGFKDVHIIRYEKNVGALNNVKHLFDIVKTKHTCYIYSEDDNEFSPNFLEYMNAGLSKFQDNEDVIAICGCVDPKCDSELLTVYPNNAFPMMGYNAWGVGVWFDKKPSFSFTSDDILLSFMNIYKIFKSNHSITLHRLMYRKRSNLIGDLQWRIYCVVNKKFCIFPKVPKVRNWGFDGSGNTCTVMSSYSKIKIDENDSFIFDDFEIKLNDKISKLQKSIYGLSGIYFIAFVIEYLLFRITGGLCFQDIKIIRKLMNLRVKRINSSILDKS